MQRANRVLATLGLCALAAAVLFWQSSKPSLAPLTTDESSIDPEVTRVSVTSDPSSPFAVQNTAEQAQMSDKTAISPGLPPADSVETTGLVQADASVGESDVDVTTLGHSPIGDAEFEQLAAQFRNNPLLLQQLIDEFRQETVKSRQLELARLLGEVGGPDVTLTASELIYSGDAQSRRIGLELLQQIQPDNAQAREIASSLLATEIEPDVLVSTLTTLVKPGNVDRESRAFLAEQVAFLTAHDDSSVRSISLNILSRWSNDSQFTPVLLNGLSDPVDVVRESAAYSLVGHEDVNDDVINRLFAVAIDSAENHRVRRGSIRALSGMAISDVQRDALVQAERELDTRRR